MIPSVSVMPKAACQPPIARTPANAGRGFGDALSVAIDDKSRGSDSEVAVDEPASEARPRASARPSASRPGDRSGACSSRSAKSARENSPTAADPAGEPATADAASAGGAVAGEPEAESASLAVDAGTDEASSDATTVVADVALTVPEPVRETAPASQSDGQHQPVAGKGGGAVAGDLQASQMPMTGEIGLSEIMSGAGESELAAEDADATSGDAAPEGQPFVARPPSPRHHADGHAQAAGAGRAPQAQTAPETSEPTPLPQAAAPATPPATLPGNTAAVMPSPAAQAEAAVAQAADAKNADTNAAAELPDAVAEVADAAAAASTAGDTSSRGEGQSEHGESTRQASSDSSSSGRAPAATFTLVQSADGTLRLAHVSAQQPPVMASMTPQERAENITQLIQTMRVMRKDGVSESIIRLRPDHLGEVSIAIRVDGKTVTATVQAESAGVREWLQSQEESIRSNLSQQGLSLDKLHVHRDPKHDRRGQHDEPEQHRHRPRRSNQPEPRFEVSA